MKPLSVPALITPVLALISLSHAVVNTRAETTRTFYVSATDSKGAVVADLTAADITVKEGGKDYPVKSLQPAKTPMQVAIVVDDGGSGAYQAAVGHFLQKAFGRGKFALIVLNPKALNLVDFTSEFDPLKTGLAQIGARSRVKADGDQLPDTIDRLAKTFQQTKPDRPVIVVFTIAGGNPEVVDPVDVLSALRQSGASLNVVSATGADLGLVMNDGPKQSGGRIELAGNQAAMAPAAVAIADTLLGQYQLTYVLPDGVRMSDRLAVVTSRKGVTITAPTRIPDR